MNRLITKWHKWLGLVIGIQVVLWVVGGVVMSWFDIEQVRGEHNIARHTPLAFDNELNLAQVHDLLDLTGPLQSLQLADFMGQPAYLVGTVDGETALYHASTLQKISPVDAEVAGEVARYDFAGVASPSEAEWLTEPNTEYRGPTPVWRVVMNDAEGTRLYISPFTGRVVARRNDVWRLYDFFWMLHIMDYKNRTDFNHPLIVWASILALVLSITGIVMLFYRFKKRDFQFFKTRNKG